MFLEPRKAARVDPGGVSWRALMQHDPTVLAADLSTTVGIQQALFIAIEARCWLQALVSGAPGLVILPGGG